MHGESNCSIPNSILIHVFLWQWLPCWKSWSPAMLPSQLAAYLVLRRVALSSSPRAAAAAAAAAARAPSHLLPSLRSRLLGSAQAQYSAAQHANREQLTNSAPVKVPHSLAVMLTRNNNNAFSMSLNYLYSHAPTSFLSLLCITFHKKSVCSPVKVKIPVRGAWQHQRPRVCRAPWKCHAAAFVLVPATSRQGT